MQVPALARPVLRAQVAAFGRQGIVEQQSEGDDHCVLVVGQRVAAAARRVPPEVSGDGPSTVRELEDAVNADSRRSDGHEDVLT